MKIKGGLFIMSSLPVVKAYLKDKKIPFFSYDIESHAEASSKQGYCLVVGIDNALAAAKVKPDINYLVLDGPGPVRSAGLPVLDAYEVKPFCWVKHALPVHLKDYLFESKLKSNTVNRMLVSLAKRKLEKHAIAVAKKARLAKKKTKSDTARK